MIASLLVVAANPAGAVSLGTTASFAAGTAPASVAVGDLNRDGHPDVVVANRGSDDVSVLLGDGTGSLGPAASFPAGTAPASVALGDLNNDGNPDVVVADNGSGAVSVLLGNGAGGLGVASSFPAGSLPASVALGDLNGDGRLDVVVANNGSSVVSVFFGDGAGNVGAPTSVNFGGAVSSGPAPGAVALPDVNGDGTLDLVVAVRFGGLTTSLGNGSGGFSAVMSWGPNNDTVGLAVGDVDLDGDPDFVTQTSSGSTVLYRNTRCYFGPCSAPAEWGTSSGGRLQFQSLPISGSGFVALGDLNGAQGPDLVETFIDSVAVRLDIGSPATLSYFGAGQRATSLALGDLNGDGKPDVVVANGGSNDVSVMLNTTAPVVNLSATSLGFGDQEVGTTSAARTIVVTNWGERDLHVSGVSISGSNATDFATDATSCLAGPVNEHPAGTYSSCSIDVVFTPGGAGARSATLLLASDAPTSPDRVDLSGNGLLLADLAVTVTGPSTVKTRSSLGYTLSVSNAGPTNASNVVLTDPTPYGTSFQSLQAPAGWVCTAPPVGKAGTVRCTTPSLAKGAAASTSLVVKVTARPDRGVVNNTATVTSDAPDPNTVNNSASLTTSVAR